jgi:hypothetical protein
MTTPILETAGWTLIHFLWQGCALCRRGSHAAAPRRASIGECALLIACAALVVMAATPASRRGCCGMRASSTLG